MFDIERDEFDINTAKIAVNFEIKIKNTKNNDILQEIIRIMLKKPEKTKQNKIERKNRE